MKQAFDAYNAVAKDRRLPVARDLTPDRIADLRTARKQHKFAGWLEGMANLRASAALCGGTDIKFRADLDWLLKNPVKLRRLIEGGYGNGMHADGAQPAPKDEIPEHVRNFEASKRAGAVHLKVVTSC